jgi:hypothetical protein
MGAIVITLSISERVRFDSSRLENAPSSKAVYKCGLCIGHGWHAHPTAHWYLHERIAISGENTTHSRSSCLYPVMIALSLQHSEH